ncbi:MAG: N-acetylmuramoyl-L-alanine amidase [Vallitalea sp.]|nr:N-acetylmuramoyl-L-alanine amidase [Vallitalea sp.]
MHILVIRIIGWFNKMKLEDKLGYNPLLIFDKGYNEHMYSLDKTLMSISKNSDFVAIKEFNNNIIKQIMDKGIDMGFNVVDVTTEDFDISLEKRVNRANKNFVEYNANNKQKDNKVLYIALQYDPKACNWDDTNNNFIIYHLHNNSDSENLANLINNELTNILGENIGFVKPSKQYILKQTEMNAIIIDGNFKDLNKHIEWMKQEDFVEEMAQRILTGCLKYFGIKDIGSINMTKDSNDKDLLKKLQKRIDTLEKKVAPWEKM